VRFRKFGLNFNLEFNSMQAKEILKQHIAKIALLTDQEFDYFFSHFKLQCYTRGQTIITEGDKVECEYFVVDGCLKSFYINDDMKMFVLQFAMSTWWASDYNALYSGEKAKINVDCLTNAEVLCLSNIDREKLCREIHQVEHFFRWRTNKGYVAAQRRLLSHMNNDAKQRYEELMNQYPALYNMVPKHLIAAYLGVSRETLSRLYNS
jgi:CRP-like cAMP-binding protein